MENRVRQSRILIIDDQPSNISLLRQILERGGFRTCEGLGEAKQALTRFCEFNPDIVLLDVHMPGVDGISLLRQLRSRIPDSTYLPVIIMTADTAPKVRQNALSLGAKDFITKPFDATEVLLRIQNLLETRFLYLALNDQNKLLEERVRERTLQLELAQRETLKRLALASDYRDDNTGAHSHRVGHLSSLLAASIGLPSAQAELIGLAAPLHDIGKIAVPDSILLKPAKLTAEEYEIVKKHTTIGASILAGSDFELLQTAAEIAQFHHERWDGTGQNRLGGEQIPISARIVCVADTFDVLTHDRPYKTAWTIEAALEEVKRERGRQFDPAIVDALLRIAASEDLSRLQDAVGLTASCPEAVQEAPPVTV